MNRLQKQISLRTTDVKLKLALLVPGKSRQTGIVTSISASPDGMVIAIGWQKGGYALFTVFGALLHSTILLDFSSDAV